MQSYQVGTRLSTMLYCEDHAAPSAALPFFRRVRWKLPDTPSFQIGTCIVDGALASEKSILEDNHKSTQAASG
jgi:hypothetical protein